MDGAAASALESARFLPTFSTGHWGGKAGWRRRDTISVKMLLRKANRFQVYLMNCEFEWSIVKLCFYGIMPSFCRLRKSMVLVVNEEGGRSETSYATRQPVCTLYKCLPPRKSSRLVCFCAPNRKCVYCGCGGKKEERGVRGRGRGPRLTVWPTNGLFAF